MRVCEENYTNCSVLLGYRHEQEVVRGELKNDGVDRSVPIRRAAGLYSACNDSDESIPGRKGQTNWQPCDKRT